MKLELKHLSPYMPYELKCWVKDYPLTFGEKPTNGIQILNGIYFDSSCVFHNLIESFQGFKDFKPILRPITDLSKQINHNEKCFIPLIEIAKSYDIKVNDEDAFLENNKIVWYEILEDPNDRDQPIDNECKFYFDITKSLNSEDFIFQKVWEDEVMLIPNNNIQPFDYQEMCKLFEWHFDVFGLIDKGLAIDINTLES